MQRAKSATAKECKSKILQRVKVQHKLVQYIKRAQHKKSAICKDYDTKKCNMETVQYEKVQHEKSATWKVINCHSEMW